MAVSSLWHGDDITYINVAWNFHKSKQLVYNYIGSGDKNRITSDLPPLVFHPTGKAILYFLILGEYFDLTNPQFSDAYLYASYFSNITSSIFLILFYLFVRRYFSLPTAIISTVLILVSPLLVWHYFRVITENGLFLSFSILCFIFLKQTKKDHVLFAIISTCAICIHPFGIFLPISYGIFLLSKSNWRGFLVFFAAWQISLLPRNLYNLFYFGDIGAGSYMPFTDRISQLFHYPTTITTPTIDSILVHHIISPISPFIVFYNIIFRETAYYNSDIFILIIIVFAIVALVKLKNSQMSDIHKIISIYAIFNLVGEYVMALLANDTPEFRQLLLPFLLLVPLAVTGIKRIIHIKYKQSGTLLLVLAIIPFLAYVISTNTADFKNCCYIYPSNDMVNANRWLATNVPFDSIIASNFSEATYQQTGLSTIPIPDYYNYTQIKKVINNYNVKYFVIYDEPDTYYGVSSQKIFDLSTLEYHINNTWIYKIRQT